MEAQDPLKSLADIHLPGEVSFWPPAPGWWLLAALLLAALFFGGRALLRALVRRRRLAAALSELDESLARYQDNAEAGRSRNEAGLAYLNETNEVLRRVALVHYSREKVASLHGAGWLAFLDRCDGGSTFRRGPGAPLGDGAYRRDFDADPEALHQAARRWIENRYRAPRPWSRREEAPA